MKTTSVAFSPDGRSALSGGRDGVIRLWRLPEPDGTGSASANATPTQERLAKSVVGGLAFDGETTYILIPSLRFNGQPPCTIEAVVRPSQQINSTSRHCTVVGDSENAGIGLLTEKSQWRFIIRFGGKYQRAVSDREISIGRTIHLAGVWDGQEIRLYVDGKVQQSRPRTEGIPTLSGYPLRIAADPAGGGRLHGFFTGTIHGVRISNRVLYQEDFTPDYKLGKIPGTVLLYDLTNVAGRTVQDQSGMNHHGRLYGGE